MRRRWFTFLLLLGSTLLLAAADVAYRRGQTAVPALSREFRGAWIATVNNIDWPSKPGLPVAEQQKELAALIDSAAQLKLNCLIFQVRPACDALYPSTLEPWSEYLTGKMGQAPQPLWDPLAYAIREAHRRGMELHAWFNPYRARYKSAKGPAANRHISRTHPQLVRSYDGYQWLDPAEPAAAYDNGRSTAPNEAQCNTNGTTRAHTSSNGGHMGRRWCPMCSNGAQWDSNRLQ